MNEVLFAIEVPKTFEVGVIIGALVGFFCRNNSVYNKYI